MFEKVASWGGETVVGEVPLPVGNWSCQIEKSIAGGGPASPWPAASPPGSMAPPSSAGLAPPSVGTVPASAGSIAASAGSVPPCPPVPPLPAVALIPPPSPVLPLAVLPPLPAMVLLAAEPTVVAALLPAFPAASMLAEHGLTRRQRNAEKGRACFVLELQMGNASLHAPAAADSSGRMRCENARSRTLHRSFR